MTRTRGARRKATAPTVSRPHDPAERQADKAADVVAGGGNVSGWSFGSVPTGDAVHRDEKGTGGAGGDKDDEKLKAAAAKVGEAALETKTGKELQQKVKDTPLVKEATKFLDTTTGKVVAGGALAVGVGGLAAAKQPLPLQAPAIPLDKITPGLSAKVTVEGPVNSPTFVGLSLTYKEQGPKGKSGPTQREQIAADVARLKAQNEMFKPKAQKDQEAADEQAAVARLLAAQANRFGRSPLVPLVPGAQPKTVDVPKQSDADQPKEKDETPVQREPATAQDNDAGLDTSGVERAVRGGGRELDPALRGSRNQPRCGGARLRPDHSGGLLGTLAPRPAGPAAFLAGEGRMTRTPMQTSAPAEKASGLHAVARADSASEKQAESYAEAVTSGPGWSFGEVPVHADPTPVQQVDVHLSGEGQPLAPEAKKLAPSQDLSQVRVHTDASAADTTKRAGARALTVGSDIAFAPSEYQPGTTEGRKRIAHELAHVGGLDTSLRSYSTNGERVVHRDGNGPVAAATTLDGLPEAERKQLQVITTTRIEAPTAEKLKTLFEATSISAPATVSVDPTIPAAVAKGLTNLAGDWAATTLKPNTTFTIQLDLTKQGGTKGPYRFTYTDPPAVKGKASASRILVESLGKAVGPADATKPAAGKDGAAVVDPVADKLKAASITYSGYGTAEEEALRGAISLVPAAHLAAISGLKFARATADTDPKVSGKYFQKEHKIVMYDKAFGATDVQFVQPSATAGKAATVTSYATRQIVHEIGHAIDLRGLQQAYEAMDAAGKAVNDASGTFTSAADKKKFDDAVKAEAKATKGLKDARSRSGTATKEKPPPPLKKGEKRDPLAPKEYEDVIGTAATGNAFREAVKKDGKNVSEYAEEDFQESYAEAYSLFITTPDQLKALRPATYEYFTKNAPK